MVCWFATPALVLWRWFTPHGLPTADEKLAGTGLNTHTVAHTHATRYEHLPYPVYATTPHCYVLLVYCGSSLLVVALRILLLLPFPTYTVWFSVVITRAIIWIIYLLVYYPTVGFVHYLLFGSS